ncbi:hypothetical protein DFR70_110272 [Nocardia tenerifensis]|uniref:Uncharacterized protein n=1 Tax=Nocardia tenerifensis TaxID=228006 RepID=A0A318JWL0_9NOCA|nr:hypothetical protein [Nocardia tenerifensis]PXX60430.1 hypothetical protein DFR70_110272 [Nocardia tenerifensis]
MIAARMVAVVASVFVGAGLLGGVRPAAAGPTACAAGNPLQPTAELFATDNTATITDPEDQRLRGRLEGFELAVDGIAVQHIGLPVGSTLVSGVFWSDERKQATYERSREFHLACVDAADLHRIADRVRARFQQESVLTFQRLAPSSPGVDAFTVTIAGVDVRRFRDGLVADPVARERLVGGSVTEANTLILVVDVADLELAQRFVAGLGGVWDAASVQYGDREFVGG